MAFHKFPGTCFLWNLVVIAYLFDPPLTNPTETCHSTSDFQLANPPTSLSTTILSHCSSTTIFTAEMAIAPITGRLKRGLILDLSVGIGMKVPEGMWVIESTNG